MRRMPCLRGLWLGLTVAGVAPSFSAGYHVVLEKVLSDDPPPMQSDASCAHLVRVGLDEGVDKKTGRPLVEPEVHHLALAMRKRWWDCAAEIANTLAKYGPEIDTAFQLEQRSITVQLNRINSALLAGKPMQSISPAFEWAQSADWVFVNVKMSHKLDAPATLNVVVDTPEGEFVSKGGLSLSATKDQKRFQLDLHLHAEIVPEESTMSAGSVGRFMFSLKKKEGGTRWPRLHDEAHKKPVNMHTWWAKQEEFADELDALEDAEDGGVEEGKKSDKGEDKDDKVKDDEEAGPGREGEVGSGDRESMGRGRDRVGVRDSKEPRGAGGGVKHGEGGMGKEAQEVAALKREKKARLEELEAERRRQMKEVDSEYQTKKKYVEEELKAKKAEVEAEYRDLIEKARGDGTELGGRNEVSQEEL